MQSWDLNTGCQAAKPIPVNSFLSTGFWIKKEKKEKALSQSYLLIRKQCGPFLNGITSACEEINI